VINNNNKFYQPAHNHEHNISYNRFMSVFKSPYLQNAAERTKAANRMTHRIRAFNCVIDKMFLHELFYRTSGKSQIRQRIFMVVIHMCVQVC